jgi:hypothetical protein
MQSIWATSAGQGSGAKVEVSVDILREPADLGALSWCFLVGR